MHAIRRKLIACWETLDTFARDWRTATQSTGAVASIEMYRASTAMEPGSENSLLPTPSSAIGCYEGIDKLSAVVGRKQLTDEVGVDRSNLFQTVGAR